MNDTESPADLHQRILALASAYNVPISHGRLDDPQLVHIGVSVSHPLYHWNQWADENGEPVKTEHPTLEGRVTEYAAFAMQNIVEAAQEMSVEAHEVVLSFPHSRMPAVRLLRGIAERDDDNLVIMFVMDSDFKKSARRILRRVLGSGRPVRRPLESHSVGGEP